MEELRIGKILKEWNNQDMFYLSKCIHKVKQLDISGIRISFDGLKQLAEAIMNLNEPVCIMFYLSFTKI